MYYYIDVVGSCNLRCPSCPVGSLNDTRRPEGVMERTLFNRILDRIHQAYTAQSVSICLFNWGEPLLHPQLPLLIDDVRRRGWPCVISSNMNCQVDMESIVSAGPTTWRISISGAKQQTYGRTHKKGRIDKVLRAMKGLREQMDIHCSDIDVEVFYHLYRSNLGGELESMHNLAQEMGFRFTALPAHMMPMENYLHLKNDTLSEDARSLFDEYLIHPEELLALTADFSSDRECELLDHTMTIGHDGSVDLCCATYEPKQKVAKDFCALTSDELKARRKAAPACRRCKDIGIHKLYEAITPSNSALTELLVPRLKQLDSSGLASTILGLSE